MRIALDATYSVGSQPTGVAVYSRELLHGLASSGFADRWEWFFRSQRFWRALREPKPASVVTRFLSDEWGSRSADLFHGLNQRLPVRPFGRQVVTFHDLFVLTGEYSTPEFRARFAAQAREAVARADHIIAVSEFTKQQICSLLDVQAECVSVVHHGMTPRRLPKLPREKVVLCVGAIQKRKNQGRLARAFHAMPADWTLVLAGSSGYGAEEVLAEADSRIRVTGYLSEEELAAWYARASIFAFPSLDEGFGMPVIEAMAAGLPVITSNRSALAEVAGHAALLVHPENEDELAHALLLLAGNEKRREELAALGRMHSAQFTWPGAVNHTLDVYRKLL